MTRLFLFLVLSFSVFKDSNGFSLPTIFASSMVFQSESEIALWGVDTPGTVIQMTFDGQNSTATVNSDGFFFFALPPMPSSLTTYSIVLTCPATKQTQTLDDILFGDVYVCSGQSNMELSVIATVNATEEIAASDQYGASLRIMQVANLASYMEATTPQLNMTASIPWTRVGSANVGGMSALCYYYGVQLVLARPSVPVGLVHSSWGGTPIEYWMSPEALESCGEGSPSPSFKNPDPGLDYMKPAPHAPLKKVQATPNSCLYFSMIYPLLTLPLKGWLWYQGEANAGNPLGYEKCFPAMIEEWRADWVNHTNGVNNATAPFLFVQLSSWPQGDNGVIANQRYAQTFALQLPNVGMAVAADIGDPAGAFHPIHPPWKQELARRVYLAGENIIYGNTAIPVQGPQVKAVYYDAWNATWGNYHYGYGDVNVCTQPGFYCAGIRVAFDQPIELRFVNGFDSVGGYINMWNNGFELWNTAMNAFQPLTLTGVRSDSPYELQLNVTFVSGTPGFLYFAFHDYPVMPVVNSFGQPAPPFNISIPFSDI